MVIAQTILAIPIVTALVHRASERAWARYGDELITDGATRLQAVRKPRLSDVQPTPLSGWL
jgi:tungstate transport system permease protein